MLGYIEGSTNKSGKDVRRTCILILGMHRSGTSALSRVLNLLGCGLPDNIIGSGIGNETGHWEPRSLVLFNDDLLNSAGSRWDDWQQVNQNWYNSSSYDQYKAKARYLFNTEFQDFPLTVIKDPRINQVIPFWTDVLRTENVNIKVIIPIRHPNEVAASLEARDTTEINYSKLLWMRRVLDAERDTRGCSRVFCTYDQLLGNWRSLIENIENSLDITFPRRSTLVDQEIDTFLNKNLRHQIAERSEIHASDGASAWLQQTYDLLWNWSEYGEDQEQYPQLDTIRSDFDKASGQFASFILPDSRSGQPGEGGRQLNALRSEIEILKSELMAAQNDLAQDHRNFDELSTARDEMLQVNQRLHEEAANKDAVLHDNMAQIAVLQNALDQAYAKVQELNEASEQQAALQAQNREQSEVERSRLHEQLTLTENILRQRDEEIEQTRAELATYKEISNEVGALRQKLLASEAWVFKLADARQAAEQLIGSLTKDKERQQRDLADKARDVSRLQRRLEVSEKELLAIGLDFENKLGVSHVEIAQLTLMLAHKSDSMSALEERLARETAELKLRLDRSYAEIAQLTQMLSQKDNEVVAQDKNLGYEVTKLQSRLATGHVELAELTRMLMGVEACLDDSKKDTEWLKKVTEILNSCPAWWHILPKKFRERRLSRRLTKKRLFDGEAYLETYPDVLAAGMEPLHHYITHGMAEKRIRFPN